MEASKVIREAMARVAAQRQLAGDEPELWRAVHDIKKIQAQRFSWTYADLLASPAYAPSATFFLDELYSARDFSLRDEQFARIAGALEFTFPDHVVATAVSLARLHDITEQLDLAMAQSWVGNSAVDVGARYVSAWQCVGRQAEREWQLATVLTIGERLTDLTRRRSLRLMLKMMRKPAKLAGLDSLQMFLETGFDRFAGMASNGGTANDFLEMVKSREADWIAQLFNSQNGYCENVLKAATQAALSVSADPLRNRQPP